MVRSEFFSKVSTDTSWQGETGPVRSGKNGRRKLRRKRQTKGKKRQREAEGLRHLFLIEI